MNLYYVNFLPLTDAELCRRALAPLPAWRRERALSLRQDAARAGSVGAGLLLGYALRKAGEDPNLPVTILPAGKPVVTGREDLWFSLSHGTAHALCALGSMPLGADIQELRPWKESILRRFCPEERDLLLSLPEAERQTAFFRLWTRKESWVKAASRNSVLALDGQCVMTDADGWHFCDYALADGTAAALCARSAEFPQKPKELRIQELLEM